MPWKAQPSFSPLPTTTFNEPRFGRYFITQHCPVYSCRSAFFDPRNQRRDELHWASRGSQPGAFNSGSVSAPVPHAQFPAFIGKTTQETI
jgi:hypothetical protein